MCIRDSYADGHPVENSTLRLDTLCRKRFSYRPEYGDGLTISCIWIERHVTHSFSATIQKPRPDMSLSPTWSVFRDFTCPGSEESWTLTLPSSDSVRFRPHSPPRSMTRVSMPLRPIHGHSPLPCPAIMSMPHGTVCITALSMPRYMAHREGYRQPIIFPSRRSMPLSLPDIPVTCRLPE